VAAYCLVKTPGFLATLLPLCLLISLLYALGKLHHANEITAMRAAGLGLARITRSVWVAGVFFCALVWWLNATVVPWSVEETRTLWEELQVRQELKGQPADSIAARKAVTFENAAERRLWFINRYGVTISERDPEGRETTRWLAAEAWRDAKGAGWTLRDGRELTFDPISGEMLKPAAFREKTVARFDEEPALMQVYDAKPDALSLFELRRVIAHHRETGSPKLRAYELRLAGVQAESLMPLVIIAFAIPFAVAGVRVNPAVGVSKALGLFVVYFVAMRLGLVLGGRGSLSPTVAAVLPHLALLGAGGWAWSRAR
jgi:lipopolysaccharide export system permease protein